MNKLIKEYIKSDYIRYGKTYSRINFLKLCAKEKSLVYSSLMRCYNIYRSENKIFKALFIKIVKKIIFLNQTIEIPLDLNVGKGLYMGHFSGITINPKVIIGENVNIHKGVTIGQENRGKRKGTPIIGNKVWIGVNSTIVGKIRIGDNVLISPNSFVNFNIPPNSIVIGNVVKRCENATEGYINNIVL